MTTINNVQRARGQVQVLQMYVLLKQNTKRRQINKNFFINSRKFYQLSYLVVCVERRRLGERVAAQLVRLVRLQDVEHGVAPVRPGKEPREGRQVGGVRFPGRLFSGVDVRFRGSHFNFKGILTIFTFLVSDLT